MKSTIQRPNQKLKFHTCCKTALGLFFSERLIHSILEWEMLGNICVARYAGGVQSFRRFSTQQWQLKQKAAVKKRINLVLNKFEEYQKYADDEKELFKPVVNPLRRDKELKNYLKHKIEAYHQVEAKNIAKTRPGFFLNHPLVYKNLGVKPKELENKYFVSKKVEELVAQDQIAKAVSIIRLAGAGNGTVGMNLVLKHLVSTNRFAIARDLKRAFGLWGIKDNSHTHLAMLTTDWKKAIEDVGKCDSLIANFDKIMDAIDSKDKKAQLVACNMALSNVAMFGSNQQLLSFFADLPEKDIKTYNILFSSIGKRACSQIDTNEEYLLLPAWNDLRSDKSITIDPRLARSYIYALVCIGNNLRVGGASGPQVAHRKALQTMNNFFDTAYASGEASQPDKKKFSMTNADIDVYLQVLDANGQSDKALDCFNYLNSKGLIGQEPHHYYILLKIIAANGQIDELSKFRKIIFEGLKENFRPSSEMTGLLVRTYLNAPAEKIEMKEVRRIIDEHRKVWNTRLIYVDIFQPFVKLLLRIYKDSSIRNQYPRSSKIYDFRDSYTMIIHGARTLTINIQNKHNVQMCIETINDLIQLFEHIKIRFAEARPPYFEEILEKLLNLQKEIKKEKSISNGTLIKLEEETRKQLKLMGARISDQQSAAPKSKEEVKKLAKLREKLKTKRVVIS